MLYLKGQLWCKDRVDRRLTSGDLRICELVMPTVFMGIETCPLVNITLGIKIVKLVDPLSIVMRMLTLTSLPISVAMTRIWFPLKDKDIPVLA
jgi:hypothetical protein